MLLRLAWRNLWRNKNRTFITMASVSFAVILSVLIQSLQSGVFDNLINNVVGYYSSYLQVHAKGYFEEQTLEKVLTVDQKLLEEIRQHPNIIQASPRIETYVLASGNQTTKGCLVTGVVPQAEKDLIQLDKRVTKGHYLAPNDNGVLIGEDLAIKLQLHVLDTVILLGQGFQGITAAGKYPVRGLLHFGSPDLNKRVIFMSLQNCRDFLGMQKEATTVAIAIKQIAQLDHTQKELSARLGNNLEVITWEEMIPDVVEHMKTDKGSGMIISLMLYLLVSFGIFSTLLMMMAERKFEYGMLLAIGMKKRQLAYVMTLESLFVSLAGSIVGLTISIPIIYYLKIHPIRFTGEIAKVYEMYGFEAIFPTSMDPIIFLQQTAIIAIISLVLSIYPVIKILTIEPVKYMKR